ncbi:MAG: serine--tRNA ligase [Deltaproteobacteria bacterium]|nr:serine--tRNA ligase [Deltaproteobacteria bacterium]
MLDIKYIREQTEAVRRGAIDKRIKFDLDRLLELDSAIRPLQVQWETLQAERNTLSKTIGQSQPSEREALKLRVGAIKTQCEALDTELKTKRAEFDQLMLLVPQPARADVPVGRDDTENVEVKRWGTPPQFDFKPKGHMELGESLGIIDVARGVKLAGSRSYVLSGDGARLEQAVLRFTFDLLIKRGFTPLSIPVLVSEEAMTGTGYFPTGREQAYLCERDNMALVGTAEVSLTSYHANEILPEASLPVKVMAWSNCFRREAGTYGKDTHGLYRVHQFQKIEQVIIGPADEATSAKFHDELLGNAEAVLQALELPYRVVYVCTGDLGQGQVRKHDIETWMPSRTAYSETHSCSTFHEFQARRLQLRYKDKSGQNRICHTLNNTAIASPRVLIPLLENHQRADGSVYIPQALRPYLDGRDRIVAK